MTITREELAAWKALEAEATKGPWRETPKHEVGVVSDADDQALGMVIPIADFYGMDPKANATFIAAVRNAFPRLIAALEAAWAETKSFKSGMDDWHHAAKTYREGFFAEREKVRVLRHKLGIILKCDISGRAMLEARDALAATQDQPAEPQAGEGK